MRLVLRIALMIVPAESALPFALLYKFSIKPVRDASAFLVCTGLMECAASVLLASRMILRLRRAYLIVKRIKFLPMQLADVLKVLLSFQVPVQDVLLAPFTILCFKTAPLLAQEIVGY